MGTEQLDQLLAASTEILAAIQSAEKGSSGVENGLAAILSAFGEGGEITYLKQQNTAAAAYLNGITDQALNIYNGLLDELKKLADQYGDVSAIAAQIKGIASLLEANNDAYEKLETNISAVHDGSSEFATGLANLSESYEAFDSQIQSLPTILNQMIVKEMEPLKTGIDQFTAQYEQLDQGITDYTDGLAQVKAGYDELYQGMLQAADGTAELSAGATELVKGNSELFDGASTLYGGTQSLKSGTGSLVKGGKQLSSGAKSASSGAKSLSSGAKSLSSGASSLGSGAGELYDGTVELYDGTVDLYDGVAELMDGVAELKDGTAELKDGTLEFVDKTSDIDEQIDEEIDKALGEITGSDFEQMSFVSAKNTNVGLVQFAIQTEAITIEEEETEAVEEEPASFGDKLKDLFK